MAFAGTSADITNTTITKDQEKFLNLKLLHNAQLKLVCADICRKVSQPKGTGLTAYFVRYVRMNVPVTSLSEGVDPNNSSFSLEEVTVTLDQWGDVMVLSDIAQYTAKHPLVQQALRLLADNAARVLDREIQVVWLAGTNVQYGDGTVTSRPAVTTSMKMSDSVIEKAYVTLVDGGAPKRGSLKGDDDYMEGGESSSSIQPSAHFVAIAGPQVMADIRSFATLGSWLDVAMYNSVQKIYNAEVGIWRGMRWIESNFIPKFNTLGNTTAAVASGASGGITGLVVTAVDGGGSLNSATTFYWKVTRISLTRGFEEDISIAHSTASAAAGNDESFTFALPSTAGYVYNVYFDNVATGGTGIDAELSKVNSTPAAAGSTVTVTANPSASGTHPPAATAAATATAKTVHPVYIHGDESCAYVGMQDLKMMVSPDGPTTANPLGLRKTLGYKFMGKTVILNQSFMIRVEVASAF